ncbi:MAG: ParB N-terminal domain-containing protein [Pseudolabrys sp.]|nr:ParB N-terminal domain-containing protein [Pseudolabrys sp.]
MKPLAISYKDPRELQAAARNPRTHTPRQVRQITASIQEFGFINPVLIDGSGRIVAGHARTTAAIAIGMTDVPTLCVDHLSPAQIRAYVIADNRLAEKAGWDRDLLALELQELSVELDFDVTITGFEMAEIDLLVGNAATAAPVPEEANDVPKIDRTAPAISQPGDLWQIGDHALLCGDALKAESYRRLLQTLRAQTVFTDPPFNVRIAGNVSGLGRVKHGEFAMASGEMTKTEFTSFLRRALTNLVDFSTDGSIHYLCIDWRHLRELSEAADSVYAELKNVCVWAKTNAGMGSLYRSAHEFVFVYKNGTGRHINNIELGRFGRNRTNVWTYPGASGFGKDRADTLAMHPTVKPLALVSDAILDCSNRGGIVLDAFAGSGTTLLACEKTGRKGYGIEIDCHYVDLVIRRFDELYGLKATEVVSGLTFDQLRDKRHTSAANATSIATHGDTLP